MNDNTVFPSEREGALYHGENSMRGEIQMFKIPSKLISVVILMVFMFSFMGNASAATLLDQITSDEVNTNALCQNAAYRLKQLEIIEGYEDGSLGLDRTINRAEFAKIAVYMAGMQTMANDAAEKPSSFQDIKTEDWFNGFVNIAAKNGYIKGEPNGDFRPDSSIKEGEVVTVLLRILGYNDSLERDWPADYISKAANLGVLDNILFRSYNDITRGKAFILCSNILDEYVVQYDAASNTFENATKAEAGIMENGDPNKEVPYTLLQKKLQNEQCDIAGQGPEEEPLK